MDSSASNVYTVHPYKNKSLQTFAFVFAALTFLSVSVHLVDVSHQENKTDHVDKTEESLENFAVLGVDRDSLKHDGASQD